MTPELFVVLVAALVAAAACGWYFARRLPGTRRPVGDAGDDPPLKVQYFEGLNFLLNEQPDKALEVFLRLVEVDDKTIETHLALGALYRRRGEVSLSVRVHENILARPGLKPGHRDSALFALAEDHFRAGLFDRAEPLFERLAASGERRVAALRQLLRIYEQQGDWDKAIGTYRRLELLASPEYPTAIAHYLCELAEAERGRGNLPAAREVLRRVRERQRNFPRSALLRIDIALAEADPELATRLCRRVVDLHPHLLPLVLPKFMQALAAARNESIHAAFRAWLDAAPARRADIAHAALAAGLGNEPFALECLRDLVRLDPHLSEIVPAVAGDPGALTEGQLGPLSAALSRILRRTHRYRCVECGLGSATHYWQCPGCRSWDGLSPITRLELVSRATRA